MSAFKVIYSGKNKVQLLVDGYRFRYNKKPCGKNNTACYRCVVEECNSTLQTTGELPNVQLKFNGRERPHSHEADEADNKAKQLLYKYRGMAKSNPNVAGKAAYEAVVAEKGKEGVDPASSDALQKIGSFQNHRSMFYKVRAKQYGKQPKTLEEVNMENFYPFTLKLEH